MDKFLIEMGFKDGGRTWFYLFAESYDEAEKAAQERLKEAQTYGFASKVEVIGIYKPDGNIHCFRQEQVA